MEILESTETTETPIYTGGSTDGSTDSIPPTQNSSKVTPCLRDPIVTSWLSYDSPTGDNGTGDHELNMIHNFCGYRYPEILEVREKNSHLPYYVRNLVFHQGDRNKFYLGPSPHYGLRLVKKHFFIY